VRVLSKSEYGALNVLLGISYVLANILDFGTSATIYSTVPTLLEEERTKFYRFVKSTFFFQSFLSMIVIALLLAFFPLLDQIFFKTYSPIWELYLTAISVLLFIWQNFITNILYAAKKVWAANIYNNFSNLLKTVILLMLAYTHHVTVGSVIFTFGIVGPVIFFIYILLEKKHHLIHLMESKVKREDFKLGYTVTFLVANQFFNLGSRMDLFLLSYYRSKAEVGDYALAQKIILTVITTIISITQILSPLYAKIEHKRETATQLKTSFLYMLIPSSVFVALYFMPSKVYDLFFTGKFALNTPVVTAQLSLPFILYTFANIPYLFLLYTVKKPVYILVSNVFFFVIVTVGCYILIPMQGIFGPPIAIWLAFIVSTFVLIIGFFKEYLTLPD
jgi:O-antigen/teichoic acid export membrane protein